MKHGLRWSPILCWGLVLVACQNPSPSQNNVAAIDAPKPAKNGATPVSALEWVGDYAQADYSKKDQGFDWVAVRVSAVNDSTLHISVRSRADKKKPTCTFDATAKRVSEQTYVSDEEGFNVRYAFQNKALEISPGEGMAKDALQYFCSGGGNFQGAYQKLAGPLDEKQIDPRVFVKALHWQDYFFDISTTGAGSLAQLKIESYGGPKGKQILQQETDGQVMGAETEDLDGDGFPEVLVYVQSAGSGSYGQLIAYSLQKGKTWVPIALPPLEQYAEAAKGYGGHDAFALVEKSLVRRFPTYATGDAQAQPTGMMRQIQYKLAKGKNGPVFVVLRIAQFPSR